MLIHAYNWFKFLFLILGLVNRLKLTYGYTSKSYSIKDIIRSKDKKL